MALVVYVLVLLGTFLTVSAGDDCEAYFGSKGFHESRDCSFYQFCCGSCDNRYCCSDRSLRLTEDDQNDCFMGFGHSGKTSSIIAAVVSGIFLIIIFISCCVCPCCCLYKICRKPRPVLATTTHTTTVVATPYPQNTTPAQQYPGYQPGYQPVPAQPGYGTPAGYGGQSMPSAPYQGQPYAVGPPPPYQENAGPGYPMNYSQAAFTPGQQAYPLQPPAPASYQAQPPPPTDLNAIQPAYNPDYVPPPSKPGY